MTYVLQSDRNFISDLLKEVGGHEVESRVIRNGQGDQKTTVQMAVNRRLAILENIKRNRIDAVARRLNVILNENEEALTVTVRGHIEAALRLCTLAALDSRAGEDVTPRERIARVVAWEHFGIAWHHMEKQSHADVLAMVDRMLDSRAGDAGEELTANSMDLVEGVCTPIKALQPSYDPLNGYVTDNLPRWILDGWTGGNETYEGASEQMQHWANDAARAVVAGIREDMESLEPATPAPAVDAQDERHPGWTECGHAWLDAGAPVAPAVDASGGWIVSDADGVRWRAWENGSPAWTEDREQATRYHRREDAEAVHRDDDDAWRVVPFGTGTASGSIRHAMERVADLSERWADSLVSQINEIARGALANDKPATGDDLRQRFRDASRGLGRAGTVDWPGGPYMSMADAAAVYADLMQGGTGRGVIADEAAVDAVPAGEVEGPLNRDDLYRFMDALKLSEKRDVAKAIGFDPAPLPGENDMDRWKRMWAWAAENDKKVELATAIRAALSHGEADRG